jgi:hypothetical protein
MKAQDKARWHLGPASEVRTLTDDAAARAAAEDAFKRAMAKPRRLGMPRASA